MKFRKIRKNVKAISPVISVLLMIAVAVVASLVAYAWVMGYIGFQTAKTGQAVQIQSVAFAESGSTGNMYVQTVYLQNVGDNPVKVIGAQCLYIKGTLDSGASVTGLIGDNSLDTGATATISASTSAPQVFSPGDVVTVKVTTEGGTYSQISQVVPEPPA